MLVEACDKCKVFNTDRQLFSVYLIREDYPSSSPSGKVIGFSVGKGLGVKPEKKLCSSCLGGEIEDQILNLKEKP